MQYINVYPFLPIYKSLTYKIPEHLKEFSKDGIRAIVPFKNKKILGIIYGEVEEKIEEEKIKEVECLLDEEPILNKNLLKLCYEISNYYFSPFGETIKLFFSSKYLKVKEPLITLTIKGSLEGDQNFLELFKKPKTLSFFQKDEKYFKEYLRYKNNSWIEEKKERKNIEYYIKLYSLPQVPFDLLIKKAGKSKKKIEILELLKNYDYPITYSEIKKNILIEENFLNKMEREGLLKKIYKEKEFFPSRYWLNEKECIKLFDLTKKQFEIYEIIKKSLLNKSYKTFLLYGITASGKSEIYLHLSDFVLKNNGNVLILVPEISLTPILATKAIQIWREKAGMYHSNLSERERNDVYSKVKKGEIKIIIGTRSALFLPFEKIDLIIVDEEQDSSYKQEETPRYNARDMAVLRGSIENSIVLLSSATPSIESMANCEKGKYQLLKLKERIDKRPLPSINVINTKETKILNHEHGWVIFTETLIENLKKHLDKGNQAILLIPRRGYAPILMCRVCGYTFNCPNCALSFTVHKRKNKLICHWCNKEEEIPSNCLNCGGEVLESIGVATEKIFEIFKKIFPDISAGILDRDTLSKKEELKTILFNFETEKIKVLIGTQLVAKGHHFPNVTFIGILNADFLLKFPDFRGPEKLFSLIVQVSGRAGRGSDKGEVFIQTENPNHYAINMAIKQDFEDFYEKEKNLRKLLGYPPFTSIALLTIHNKNLNTVLKISNDIKKSILKLDKRCIDIKGPYPAPYKKLKNEYRFQILFRSPSRNKLHNFLLNFSPYFGKKSISIDLDPINFL